MRAPRFVVALAATLLVGACSGTPQSTVPADASSAPGASGAAGTIGNSASPLATPDAALLAALTAAGLDPHDISFMALTTFDVTSGQPGAATIVEHLASGDTVTIDVSIAAATGGTPGLVSATSSTTDAEVQVHLVYLVSADGMSDEALQSLEGVAAAGQQMANAQAGARFAADVSIFQVTLDWAISKVKGTARDTAIENILKGAAPNKGAKIMRALKYGLTAEKAGEIYGKLDAQLAELDKLEECAKNPTNPLTIKQYKEEPGARDRVLEQIREARNHVVANAIVIELGVVNGVAAGFGPKWLGYAIGPGTSWSKETLEKLNQERLDEIKRAVPKCECVLVTQGVVDPLTWRGEHRHNLDNEWLIQGKSNADGYDETWIYRAVIDPRTNTGTYKYEAIGSIASGTLTKNGTGDATLAVQPDGSAITTFGSANVKGVITAGGTTQTVNFPVPETAFTWKPVGSSQSCSSPGS